MEYLVIGKSLHIIVLIQIEQTEFQTGQTVTIKGIAVSDANRLEIDVINQSGQVVESLGTPITSDNTFSLPWTIPSNFDTGIYTITVTDNVNTDNLEIFVQ